MKKPGYRIRFTDEDRKLLVYLAGRHRLSPSRYLAALVWEKAFGNSAPVRLRRPRTNEEHQKERDAVNAWIAKDMKAAREEAGLTQTDLAAKLKKSVSMIQGAETGRIKVSDKYMLDVLKACGLPSNWMASKSKAKAKKA